MPTFTLPSGVVSFDLPAATRLTAEEGPMAGWIGFGPLRQIFYDLLVADFSDVDDIEAAALHQALNDGETIAAVPTDRGSLFADVLTIEFRRGLLAPKGRYFLRLDRLPNGIVRILKITPGRADGESRAERAKMDALGLDVAAAARFAPGPTPVDRTAVGPGTFMLKFPRRFYCPLPPGWTVHDPGDLDPEWTPDEDEDTMVCLGPEEAICMYVTTLAMTCDPPLTADELADHLVDWREEDLEIVRGVEGMGETVELADLGPGRYLVQGDFGAGASGSAGASGFLGRHLLLRAVGPSRTVRVNMTALLPDPNAAPGAARALLDPLDAAVRRAYLFVDQVS